MLVVCSKIADLQHRSRNIHPPDATDRALRRAPAMKALLAPDCCAVGPGELKEYRGFLVHKMSIENRFGRLPGLSDFHISRQRNFLITWHVSPAKVRQVVYFQHHLTRFTPESEPGGSFLASPGAIRWIGWGQRKSLVEKKMIEVAGRDGWRRVEGAANHSTGHSVAGCCTLSAEKTGMRVQHPLVQDAEWHVAAPSMQKNQG